jgi:hypothetical protein
MVLSAVLLAWMLGTGAVSVQKEAVPVQNSIPQACFVFGEVFWSETQVSAMLSSNCPIHIERKESLIAMSARHKTVMFMIPQDPGVHSFVYRWGNRVALFDDEKVEVALGPGAGEMLSRRSHP